MNLDNLSLQDRIKVASIQNQGGYPQHYNSSVGTSSVTVRFENYPSNIVIFNSHASNNLYVSFDGTNFFTLLAQTTLQIEDATFYDVYVKGSGASTTFEIIYY